MASVHRSSFKYATPSEYKLLGAVVIRKDFNRLSERGNPLVRPVAPDAAQAMLILRLCGFGDSLREDKLSLSGVFLTLFKFKDELNQVRLTASSTEADSLQFVALRLLFVRCSRCFDAK